MLRVLGSCVSALPMVWLVVAGAWHWILPEYLFLGHSNSACSYCPIHDNLTPSDMSPTQKGQNNGGRGYYNIGHRGGRSTNGRGKPNRVGDIDENDPLTRNIHPQIHGQQTSKHRITTAPHMQAGLFEP
ncbi:hypothetical protein L2E82_26838 [Cichorium intybus]|uniref:Uncharacterized protein n=1 Tax=Cichorium intybus TaxID=13427 RepID=A0ACB9CRJ7_CICIN|nr:hypothetical protein L2E82_26838 [Cichorium intybus]